MQVLRNTNKKNLYFWKFQFSFLIILNKICKKSYISYKDVSIAEIKGGEKSIAGRRSHGPRKVGLCEEPGH